MKAFTLALAAVALTATPVLAAPSSNQPSHSQPARNPAAPNSSVHNQIGHNQIGHGHTAQRGTPPRQPAQAHQWKRNDRFDRNKATNYRVISNPRAYRLQNAPNGYRWVQSGRDAVLVRLSNNVISSVIANAIR